MSVAELKSLREERATVVSQMRELSEAAGSENRALTPEEDKKWSSMESDEKRLHNRIQQMEKLDAMEADLSSRRERDEKLDDDARRRDRPTSADYRNVFKGWAMGGARTAEMVASADRCNQRSRFDKNSWDLKFKRRAPTSYDQIQTWITRATTDVNVTNDTTLGGNIVENEAMAGVERALLGFGGVREAARVVRTQTGATLQIPTNNDTGNKAVIVGQGASIDTNNVQFGQQTMTSYKYSSQFVKASVEFMQDASFDFDRWITDVLGERVARGLNEDFTIGVSSSGEPDGVATGAIAITTGTQITYDGLVKIEHSLDPSYRRLATTRWMFHDSVLRRVKQLTDSQGRLLWVPGVAAGEPDTILGYPYTINQDMATDSTAGTTKQVLFGDFNHYIVRDVMDVELRRLDERFADEGVVAFFTLSRHDGLLIVPSTVNPPIVAATPAT